MPASMSAPVPTLFRSTCSTVTRAQVDEFEMALLANLTPETVDEALSIVPSLKVCCQHLCPVPSYP